MRLWRLDQKVSPRTTKDVDLLKRILGNLHGIPRVRTHFLESNKTNNRSDGKEIGHAIHPDKRYSTKFVERM